MNDLQVKSAAEFLLVPLVSVANCGRVLCVHPERVAAMGEMEKQNHRHVTTNLPLFAYLVYVMT